jgi:arginyl-tRNA synthetase
MQKNPDNSRYRAIKQLVSGQIMMTLSNNTDALKFIYTEHKNIPLYKGRDNNRIFYISGIAIQLEKYEKFPPMDIACAIASHFSATSGKNFKVQIVPPGWIHLELTHATLSAWLQSLVEGEGGKREQGSQRRAEVSSIEATGISIGDRYQDLFTIQYIHARCCSLMRLAQQDGLGSFFQSIPWLDDEEKLRLTHPASFHLISELIQIVDELEGCSLVKLEKAALNLSRAFEDFWKHCRILGDVKTTSPELAQARLGLVMATRSVLRFVLEEKLGLFAFEKL